MDSLPPRTPLPPGKPKASKAKGSANTKSKKSAGTSTHTKVSKPAGVSKTQAVVKEAKVLEEKLVKMVETVKQKNGVKVKAENIDVATMSETEKLHYLANFNFVGRAVHNDADKKKVMPEFLYRNDPKALEVFKSITYIDPPYKRSEAMNSSNKARNFSKLEDRPLLKKLVTEACKAKNAALKPKDFKAITWAYNLKVKYDWDTAKSKKSAAGYLPRGWNTMHSLICKDWDAFGKDYGHLITDWKTIKAGLDKDTKRRRDAYEKKEAAKKAASASVAA